MLDRHIEWPHSPSAMTPRRLIVDCDLDVQFGRPPARAGAFPRNALPCTRSRVPGDGSMMNCACRPIHQGVIAGRSRTIPRTAGCDVRRPSSRARAMRRARTIGTPGFAGHRIAREISKPGLPGPAGLARRPIGQCAAESMSPTPRGIAEGGRSDGFPPVARLLQCHRHARPDRAAGDRARRVAQAETFSSRSDADKRPPDPASTKGLAMPSSVAPGSDEPRVEAPTAVPRAGRRTRSLQVAYPSTRLPLRIAGNPSTSPRMKTSRCSRTDRQPALFRKAGVLL